MFCSKCGNLLTDEAKFCPRCGQAVSRVANNSAETYMLAIVRENQFFLVNPSIKIHIDGGQEYKLDNGQKLNIPVTAGEHKISFSCGIRNKVLDVSVNDDFVLNVKWDRITGSLKVDRG